MLQHDSQTQERRSFLVLSLPQAFICYGEANTGGHRLGRHGLCGSPTTSTDKCGDSGADGIGRSGGNKCNTSKCTDHRPGAGAGNSGHAQVHGAWGKRCQDRHMLTRWVQ